MRSWIAAALVLAAPALAAAQTVATDPVPADPPPPPPPPEAEPAPPPDPPVEPLVVATDPVVVQPVVVQPVAVPVPEPVYTPPPEPYSYPDYQPTDTVPSESTLFLATATQARMTGDDGLEVFAHGASIGFAFLQRDGEFPTGGEVSAVFLSGEDAAMYDLQIRIYGSPEIGRKKLVPYLALGLAVGASRLETAEDKMAGRDATYGLSIGPTASAGVHGFLSDKLYWRAGAGFLGTGIGAITADLGLGLVIGD